MDLIQQHYAAEGKNGIVVKSTVNHGGEYIVVQCARVFFLLEFWVLYWLIHVISTVYRQDKMQISLSCL
jgi:hypothetical protein